MNSGTRNNTTDTSDADELPEESKSERKRQALQITKLASQLIALQSKKLAAVPLADKTREAIIHCTEIRAHGARKRQLHYVSKLLRDADNLEDIQRLVDQPELIKSRVSTASKLDPYQMFRDQLLQDLSACVDTLREDYPTLDLQTVRQLVRRAIAESKPAEPESLDPAISLNETKSAKKLLQLLAAANRPD